MFLRNVFLFALTRQPAANPTPPEVPLGGTLKTSNFLPGIQKKNYGDDSKYLGQLLGQDRHGRGIYYYPTGDIYAGEWEGSTFQGSGTYIFASGERYEGEFDKFKKHGRGAYYYLNGNTYEGEWAMDKKHGKGVYKYLATNGNLSYFFI